MTYGSDAHGKSSPVAFTPLTYAMCFRSRYDCEGKPHAVRRGSYRWWRWLVWPATALFETVAWLGFDLFEECDCSRLLLLLLLLCCGLPVAAPGRGCT